MNIKSTPILLMLSLIAVSCGNSGNDKEQSEPPQPSGIVNPSPESIAALAFKEVKEVTAADQGMFWAEELYGPIIVVDPQTREVWANQADPAQTLKPATTAGVYSGTLPQEINIANTAIDWQGQRWTMVMAPLPPSASARKNLLIHELYHRIQPNIGFENLPEGNNSHLDQESGRVWLKLELEALKKALNDSFNRLEHIHAALLFRTYRHTLFPPAKTNENNTEINEGLAEYTGAMLSGRSRQQMPSNFINRINRFFSTSSFVRSFAYEFIPVYGFFMAQKDPQWHKETDADTNLSDLMVEFFNYEIPVDLENRANEVAMGYNYPKIADDERVRAFQKKQQLKAYRKLLVEGPTLTLNFLNANFSFDYTVIVPLGDEGTVYPEIRVTDNWGILTVTEAALMSPNWDKITVPAPSEEGAEAISGRGWQLELNEGWEVRKKESAWSLIQK